MQQHSTSGLIGYSGFVGQSLLRQRNFTHQFRSTDAAQMADTEFDLLVCAAAPAQKWLANRDPDSDRRNLAQLMAHLRTSHCKQFVLISTVDVFARPQQVNEISPVSEHGLHAYGLHRLQLEQFVRDHFERTLIVRLPGLVGPGLRKNVIFDLLNHNNLQAIDSRGVFQFYPMVNLWPDILTALDAQLNMVHLTAAPVSVAEVAWHGFKLHFDQPLGQSPAAYDMQTVHAEVFGGHGAYQYTRKEALTAIRAYAQSEPLSRQG